MGKSIAVIIGLQLQSRTNPRAYITFNSGRELPHFIIDSIFDGGMLGHNEQTPDNLTMVMFANVETVEFE